MIIVGHSLIEYKKFFKIERVEDIAKRPSATIVLSQYNEEIIAYCKKRNLEFSLFIQNEKEAILANALNAYAILCPAAIAPKIQNLAEYYLFDAKVALMIDTLDELDMAIEAKVDMAILKNAVS